MTESWEDDAWEADDGPDRDDVLRLARQLAEQRARQRVHDLAELDELKRTLRERAAEVASREAEVERAWAEIHEREGDPENARRRILRLRRERPTDEDVQGVAAEALATREAALEQRAAGLAARERELANERERIATERRDLERLHADASRTSDELAARASEAETADQELAGERERLAALQVDLQERERAVAQVEENSKAQREGDNEARDSEPIQRETGLGALAARLAAREEKLRLRERQLDDARLAAAREPAAPLKRNAELAQRETELRTLETRLAEREADVLRMQTALAAREEELRRRERELDDAQRLSERAAAIPLEPYLSFSEGLESLAGRSDRHWP